MTKIELFATGLVLPEAPRWHDGRLWISDMWDHVVLSYDSGGGRREEVRFDEAEDPGGLGWLPDGDLLVVGMVGRVVYRVTPGGTRTVHADLSELSPWESNDMIVRGDGTAFVSHFGYDMFGGTTPFQPASIIRVRPDGRVDEVVKDVLAPNGMALPPDETTLYLSECATSTVLAFDIADDGRLANRRSHVSLPRDTDVGVSPPDGICLDEEGAVWAAEPLGKRALRMTPEGSVTDEIELQTSAFAVVLGGEDRRTLFICSGDEHEKKHRTDARTGRIDVVRVDVPGAGRP